MMIHRYFRDRRLSVGVLGMLALTSGLVLTGCHGLLDTTNPMFISEHDVANATGADGLRITAVTSWIYDVGSTAYDVALFTDELSFDTYSGNSMNPDWMLDLRDGVGYEAYYAQRQADPHLQHLAQDVSNTALAIPSMRQYGDPATKNEYLAQLFTIRGHAILQMAEDLCPGFPINDIDAVKRPILSQPYTTDSALHYAITQFDSALAHGHDSIQFVNSARVLRGRALLDLGDYDAAAAAVSAVPDDFIYATPSPQGFSNYFYGLMYYNDWSYTGYPVGDRDGRNGLAFVSENDTIRIKPFYKQQRITDTSVAEYGTNAYGQEEPYRVASGTEARLIEAEVAYQHDDPSWFVILNTLRKHGGLDTLIAMPTTDTGKVNLIYHERAFWLYLTAHRLGDLRRLIRHYQRNAEDVFPTGDYPILGKRYQTATAIPFVQKTEQLYNPNITSGCTTR